MEETSESLDWLEKYEIQEFPLIRLGETSTIDDDVEIIFKPQDDTAVSYQRLMLSFEEDLLNRRREIATAFNSFVWPVVEPMEHSFVWPVYSDFVDLQEDLFLGEVSEEPRTSLSKTRRIRDPPPRVSRRSSEVSRPIYLRHRFLPQSRKQSSSSRRQR
ncbi:hypothetical protein ISN44_As12g008960 [Arabidopsis suecica]|uniref:Uncharacterized protein n=1 Tax=Arabidopsis suecica TaxID=45249 RepID=A0A8T1YH83_ARASU|nr:hypothetical protein ISN44_As12g008960 [Arabidopsis suecica]